MRSSGTAVGVLLIVVGMAGCAGGPVGTGRAPNPQESAGVETIACARTKTASDNTPSVSPGATNDCEMTIRRLNKALAAALGQLLPSDAVTSSNLIFQDNPQLRLGATFFPRPDPDRQPSFDAPVRIRAGERTGILDVWLAHYRAIPPTDDCPDNARLAEMAGKGMTQHRCDRITVQGSVVVVSDSSEPYGSGEYAGLLLHHLSVTAYRPDGLRVAATLSPAIERLPESIEARQAATQNILSLAQLQTLTLDPSFVLA